MTFTRQTAIDAGPTGDSVKQAILDLDQDLTGAFAALNTLNTALALKINAALTDAPGGVAGLDASGLLKVAAFPASVVMPVGSLLLWTTGTPPNNYLECNGASLATSDYAALFTVIQYAYGGAGLTFNLPDWRGQFPRGWDHGAGVDPEAGSRTGGDNVGSKQRWAIFDHQHGLLGSSSAGGSGSGNIGANGSHGYSWTDSFASAGGSPSSGQYSEHENRPVNMNAMFCIKWR